MSIFKPIQPGVHVRHFCCSNVMGCKLVLMTLKEAAES